MVLHTCENSQLPLAVSLQDPVELGKPGPLHSGHLVCVRQLPVHVLSELLEGHDGLMCCWDGGFDDVSQVLPLSQRLHGTGSVLPGPHQRAAPQTQLTREDLRRLPGENVVSQPQRHSLELFQVRQQDGWEAADPPWKSHTGESCGLAHSECVQLRSGENHLRVHTAHQGEAEQAVERIILWDCGFFINDFVIVCDLGGEELHALQGGVGAPKPGENQTLGGFKESHAKLLECCIGDL